MNHPGHILCGALSRRMRRICRKNAGKSRFPAFCRRFAIILALCAATCAFAAACSPVDSAGTIPRSNVHAPRKPHRLTVITDMLFEYGNNPVEKKTPDQWEKVKYPVCTYTDGKNQTQKRLTCPLDPTFVVNKRGYEWESDFDAE